MDMQKKKNIHHYFVTHKNHPMHASRLRMRGEWKCANRLGGTDVVGPSFTGIYASWKYRNGTYVSHPRRSLCLPRS
jgi:hypothetical protein